MVTIIGAGDLGKLVANILVREHKDRTIYFIDDNKEGKYMGYRIRGTVDEFIRATGSMKYKQAIISIGDIEDRKRIYDRLLDDNQAIIVSAIDRSVRLSHISDNIIGRGTIVKENAVIEPDAGIGVNCIIGNNSTICHDVEIGSHCRIAPGVHIAGGATIGDEVYLCPGVTVDSDIEIGDGAIVYSGTPVYNDVPPHSKVKQKHPNVSRVL